MRLFNGLYKQIIKMMTMNTLPEQEILKRYLLGVCTPEEEMRVETWLRKDPSHADLLQQLAENFGQEASLRNGDKKEIKNTLLEEIEPRNYNRASDTTWSVPVYLLKAAAVMLVVATAALGGYFYYSQTIADNEIAYKQRSLPNGQTATIRFSDGSVIQLNSGSTLRYPEKFSGDRREVYLKGEAFFTVAADKDRPFVVHTGSVQTRVLGTAFNIDGYDDQKIQVAVQEGTVSVSDSESNTKGSVKNESTVLEKNEWVVYQKDNGLQPKQKGDIREMIAWKDQVLVFNNKPLSEVTRTLERWYGVEIIIKDESLKNVVLSGKHDSVSLEKVLENIQFILGIDYTMINDTVTISSSGNGV